MGFKISKVANILSNIILSEENIINNYSDDKCVFSYDHSVFQTNYLETAFPFYIIVTSVHIADLIGGCIIE